MIGRGAHSGRDHTDLAAAKAIGLLSFRGTLPPLSQNIRPQRQHAAQPDGVVDVIGLGVVGAGVKQDPDQFAQVPEFGQHIGGSASNRVRRMYFAARRSICPKLRDRLANEICMLERPRPSVKEFRV